MSFFRNKSFILLSLAWALIPGCRSGSGDTCSLSSDCPSTQICHPSELICIEVTCEGISCAADIAGTAQEDTAAPPEPDVPETQSCDTPEVPGWRISVFEVLESGADRTGVDVDLDPSTCWPTPCEDGLDNGFEKVSMFNSVFAESIAEEKVSIAFVETETDIQIFDVSGGLTSGKAQVLSSCLDPDTLAPLNRATVDSSEDGVVAASKGFMNLKLLVAGVPLLLPVEALSIQGIMNDSTMDVLIGGAITEEALEASVFAVPKEELPDVIPNNEQLWTTIKILYKVDVDMDEDDAPESISINLRFQGTPTMVCIPQAAN